MHGAREYCTVLVRNVTCLIQDQIGPVLGKPGIHFPVPVYEAVLDERLIYSSSIVKNWNWETPGPFLATDGGGDQYQPTLALEFSSTN